MRKVYTSSDTVMIGYLRGILEDQSIQCLIKNELLLGGTGEIPAHETWPEIWVTNDTDYNQAKNLIDAALTPQQWQRDWRCPGCGEWIENQFSECWKCSSSRPTDS